MSITDQIKALETGKGIQFLLDSAYKIMNNPIFMFDADYNMIAFTDVPVDDPIWNEFATTGTLCPETFEFLAREGMTEEVVNADKVAVIRRERLNYDRMTGHIINRDSIPVGLVTMLELNVVFDDEIISAFDALVDMINRDIRNNDYFTMLAMTYHEDKINLLLDEAADRPVLFNPQAQILYSSFDEYLYVAVVSAERNDILEYVHKNRLLFFKSMLKTKYQSFKYSVYSDYIVILMSSTKRHFIGEPFLTAYTDLFVQNGLYMGVSESFENMYELRKYYDQAVSALTSGLSVGDDRRIFLHTG